MNKDFPFQFGTLKDGKWQGDGDKVCSSTWLDPSWIVVLLINRMWKQECLCINDHGDYMHIDFKRPDHHTWKLWSPPKLEWDFTKKIIYGEYDTYISMFEKSREPRWWIKYIKNENTGGLVYVTVILNEDIALDYSPVVDQGWV